MEIACPMEDGRGSWGVGSESQWSDHKDLHVLNFDVAPVIAEEAPRYAATASPH